MQICPSREKVKCVQVEFHISHGCNPTCQACTHFSQEGHSGRATVESFREEVAPWSKRLAPQYFLALGGEPLLNPDILDILEECGRTWDPAVKKILVSNGLLLHRFPNLPKVLKATNTRLDISRHHDSPEYTAKFNEIMDLVRSWNVPHKVRDSFKDWSRYYEGEGNQARPFHDGDPQRSWDICHSRWCLQLHDGRLFKCPPMAYLKMHVEKFPDSPWNKEWEPYLRYKGLGWDCSDSELTEFVNRRSEPCCAMCPSNPQPFVKPSPLRRTSLDVV